MQHCEDNLRLVVFRRKQVLRRFVRRHHTVSCFHVHGQLERACVEEDKVHAAPAQVTGSLTNRYRMDQAGVEICHPIFLLILPQKKPRQATRGCSAILLLTVTHAGISQMVQNHSKSMNDHSI